MKTLIKANGRGLLSVEDKGNFSEMEFLFGIESMPEWYPLCANYDYFYSHVTGCLYLSILPKKPRLYRYGIVYEKNRSISSYGRFDPCDYWSCSAVKTDNQVTEKLAHKLGVKTWRDSYTETDVVNGITKVTATIYQLTTKYIQAYADNINPEARRYYLGSTKTHQTQLALGVISQEQEEVYERLGEVYTMLTIMRKLARNVQTVSSQVNGQLSASR